MNRTPPNQTGLSIEEEEEEEMSHFVSQFGQLGRQILGARVGIFNLTSRVPTAQRAPVVTSSAPPTETSQENVHDQVNERILPDQEGWVHGKPTRAIASKLLDMPEYMADSHMLYSNVQPSGLFRSRRHFKQCVKILRSMGRVTMICHGQTNATDVRTPLISHSSKSRSRSQAPSRSRSRKSAKQVLRFSIGLTPRGRRVYSFYRRVSLRYGHPTSDSSTSSKASSSSSSEYSSSNTPSPDSRGLADAL